MKKPIILLLIALFGTCAYAQNKKSDWANFKRYAAANEKLMDSVPSDPRRVVFLGNSITDHWAKQRPEFFAQNDFVGRGISGQTSYQFLARFRQDVVNLHPAAVVINTGTNDCAENTHPFDIDHTMDNIMSMVEIAQANGIQVILTSVLPATHFLWNPAITDAPQRVLALNERIKAYAAEKGLPYVDYHSAMRMPDDTLNERYSTDGVHPVADGYEVMEAIIVPQVRKLVP